MGFWKDLYQEDPSHGGALVCQLRDEVALKEGRDTQRPLGCAGGWEFAVPFHSVQNCT